MWKSLLSVMMIGFVFTTSAQIQTNKGKAKKPTQKTQTFQAKDSLSSHVELYTNVGLFQSFRTLKQNEAFLIVPFGDRAQEVKTRTTGYMFGVRSALSSHFSLDFGLGFHIFGEDFTSSDPDTIYQYSNRYRYVTLPLSLRFDVGSKNVKYYVQPGLQAHFFQSYKNELIINNKETDAIVTNLLEDKNTLSLGTTVATGLAFRFADNYTFFTEYKLIYQLTNMFNTQADFIQHPYSHGVVFGLSYRL